nr:putative carboxypeptidase [Arabidopsis thaliana]
MGKPERKVRERINSSSSYFLRCFGVSRKIHSDKPIVDAGQEIQKTKKKTRTRWFSRPTKFRSKEEITPTSIYKSEKQKLTFEDDKQNLFRVIRHVTDRKNVATSGYKTVDHETKEKDTNEQRDINPEPLSFLGYDDKFYERVSTDGKLDPTNIVGSGSKPKEIREKSSRVRKRSRVSKLDPVIGISIIMLTLMIMLTWGRLCAILCTSTWCYIFPRLKEAATAVAVVKRKRSGSGKGEEGSFQGDLDLNSVAYKKKVVLEGFLVRQHRLST